MKLEEILSWHLNRYPLLQAEDIYKLIYQGVFGPGHLLTDPERERTELYREVTAVAKSGVRNEIEPVDPQGLLVRVNLACLGGSGVKTRLLFQALLKTAENFTPQPELLYPRVQQALNWCAHHLPEQMERLKRITRTPKPPPRHSAIYIKSYRPAYRVVLSRLWSRSFGSNG